MPQIDPAESARHRQDGYRALGHYFAEFSELIGGMELTMVNHFQSHGMAEEIAALPFGGLTADLLQRVFFDMAQQLREHDATDARVAKRLQNAIRDEISFRNDAAHGHWMIGYWSVGIVGPEPGPKPVPPTVERTKPGRKQGALASITEDLDERAARVEELGSYVYHYAEICFEQPDEPIGDYVRLDRSERLVPGPKLVD